MAVAAAAWRSCAIPENSAANVDAVSRGASITSPPFAVRRTVRPDTSRSISAADAIGSGSRRVTRFVTGRHHRGDLALGGFILRSSNGRESLCGRERRRDDALDAGEEASRALECAPRRSSRQRVR